jgi:hypothetical protein
VARALEAPGTRATAARGRRVDLRAPVEQERSIKESELDTDLTVEEREIRERKMAADIAVEDTGTRSRRS